MTACSVDGCNDIGNIRGMCRRHYQRQRRRGHTGITTGKGCKDLAERIAFQSKRAESGCLEWTGSLIGRGYGRTRVGGKFYTLHRLAWTLAHGPIPDGMFVCHKCDNPKCFELSHLFLGTPSDNRRDCIAKGRAKSHGKPIDQRKAL